MLYVFYINRVKRITRKHDDTYLFKEGGSRCERRRQLLVEWTTGVGEGSFREAAENKATQSRLTKTVSNERPKRKNAFVTVFLGTKTLLQRRTETSYPFWVLCDW